MAFYKLFQNNTGTFTGQIQTNTTQLYANASGVLLSVQSGKSPAVVGTSFTGALLSSVTVFTTGSAGTVSQQIIGNTGIWIPILLSGQRYAIPAFVY